MTGHSTYDPIGERHAWNAGRKLGAKRALKPRRTKAALYKPTGNPRAVQILPGHTKIESNVRYPGGDIEDALALAEGTEI